MKELMQSLCDKAKKQGADFADVRICRSESTSILRQDEKADKLSQTNSIGIGVRVLKDNAWGFASAASVDKDISSDLLDWAINMATASKGKTQEAIITQPIPINDIVSAQVEIDPRSVSLENKMKKLEEFEKAAINKAGSKLENIIHNYVDNISKELICNSYGTYIESETVRTIVVAHIVVSDGNSRQRGYVRLGKPSGFELLENIDIEDFSVKAADKAIKLLSADLPPAGKFPVIFHPSITGLLTHEALGHNAEADSVLNNTSIIGDKLNQKIASELINIIDDSTYPNKWGTYKYDSEGTMGEKRVIVENGILKGFLHSLETSARMGVKPNGSARASGYTNMPIVRMSNTYIAPGTSKLKDMIKGIDKGVYLMGGEYGYVFAEKGQFTCHAGEAYLIEDGKLSNHLRDVSVTGLTLETLKNIDMVADDFEMNMPGMCGKNGQGMYVDNGGPHVRVKEMVVGGRV